MQEARPSRHRASRLWALALCATLAVTPIAGAQGAGEPVVAYSTENGVVVADSEGQTLETFPDFSRLSLADGVLAGEVAGKTADDARVVAFDAATGARLFAIPEARLPVVTGGGRKVAFFPTFERDRYGASIWMRAPGGRLRKVVAFHAGRGTGGIRHGMDGGAAPLDVAFDGSGRTMAVVAGLEPLRSFDVWVVDVRTKEATRMTRGENSHNPSLAPDGSLLAVRVERPAPCPDDLYGEILIGKIRVVSLETGLHRDLTEHGCELFYDTPRWVDDQSLLAVRVTKDATEELGYDLDIVRIDAETGVVSDVVTEGNPCCITVSPDLDKVAYGFSDRAGFSMLDLATGTVTEFPAEAYVPHLAGEGRL